MAHGSSCSCKRVPGARGGRLHHYWQQASKRGAAKEVRFVCDRYAEQWLAYHGVDVRCNRESPTRVAGLLVPA